MTFTDMNIIYTHLQDAISQRLFTARLSVSATGDAGYITMLPAQYRNLNADIESFRTSLLTEDRKRTVIFGAGFNGVSMAKEIHMKSLAAFIDNNKGGQTEPATQLPIFSLKDHISQYGTEDIRYVISVSDRTAADAMYAQLMEEGVEPNAVLTIPSEYRNNTSQYFDLFTPCEHETFVDCGCYDGSTAFHFAGWCGRSGYDKIWCFEPDKGSYEICRALLDGWTDCGLYPYGISDKSGTVSFASGRKEESRIVSQTGQDSCENIEVVDLDGFLQGERVTFIKMDIEGAELDALRGASRIIAEQKPKLAVSIYHRPEDIIEIPGFILSLRPDYRLYIRHYSLFSNETVLYAC